MDSRWLPSLDLLLGGGGGGIPIICAAISPWVEREGKLWVRGVLGVIGEGVSGVAPWLGDPV